MGESKKAGGVNCYCNNCLFWTVTDWLKTKSRLLNFDYGIICNLQTESINITKPTL